MAFAALIDRRQLPWAVPLVAVVGVTVVAFAPRAFAGNPHPSLPARTPAQLIAAVDASTVRDLSGTVASTPKLGLPQLPGADGGNQVSTLLTESTSWKVSAAGTDQIHLTLPGKGKEMDVIRNGSSAWTWDSSTQSATHYLLPAHSPDSSPESSPQSTAEPTPMALAQKFLAAIDPSTVVGVGPSTVVAGRNAYTLVITPRTTSTLIGRVIINVDASNGVPLGVTIYPHAGAAGLSEKFSSVSFGPPSASAFAFTPPANASVTTHDLATEDKKATATSTSSQPRVIGEGWTAVAAYPGGSSLTQSLSSSLGAGSVSGGHSSAALLQDATNPGPNGSRVLQTRLFTVLLAKDGTVFAGAVPAATLESVAASGR